MPKIKAAEKVFELRIPINFLIYSRALEWIFRFSLSALHRVWVGLPSGKKSAQQNDIEIKSGKFQGNISRNERILPFIPEKAFQFTGKYSVSASLSGGPAKKQNK